MTINIKQATGVSGEFQIIVRRADGSIKLDTGMQPNLVLDNGLRFYLGIPLINSMGKQRERIDDNFMRYCYVGTGNNPPTEGDVALHNMVARNVSSREWVYGAEQPTTDLHEGFVKLWGRGKYIFDNITNQNITEVGLSTWYGSETIDSVPYNNTYALVTRSLIKDSRGTPITVTVLADEVLEVIYQVNLYVDIRRKSGEFTLTTTKGGQDITDTFEYFMQPCDVGSGNYILNPIGFLNTGQTIETWGVKETDDQITASYDLNDEVFQGLTHTNVDKLAQKTSDKMRSGNTTDKYSSSYSISTEHEQSFEHKRVSYKHINGIYAHVHTNGIRAFKVGVGWSYNMLVRGLVVVKNRANGQGIKKTNHQLWEFMHSFSISRWED